MLNYVISYDIGTTGIKTCLYEINNTIKLLADASKNYNLYILENGGIEQDPNDWWNAMCVTTHEVIEKSQISTKKIRAISFCAQMQSLVLVDKQGDSIRNSLSYMDCRSVKEIDELLHSGFTFNNINIYKLINSIIITKAVSASVKDPVWKYKWVEKNEPDNFKKVYKWLDVKDYLVCKATGKFTMSRDSAFATLLYDSRKKRNCFSKKMCKMMGVRYEHMPEICLSTDNIGNLTDKAAYELGLTTDVEVFSGGGDASLIGVGAGAVKEGDTHIYLGTSGWVSTVVSKQIIDISNMITAIIGINPKTYNYFAELETGGKCVEWVKDHLALDEINLFLDKKYAWENPEVIATSLYDYMMDCIKDVPAGSKGVIFTPWFHGNRCPFEDPNARGMFFNISLDVGKTELIHSVVEGICYHLRWQLESIEKKVKCLNKIRFVGGGALSPITCQILSDVTGKTIETVNNPQNVGSAGAAIIMAVGLGIIKKIEDCDSLITVSNTYETNLENKKVYDKHVNVFKNLYIKNKRLYNILNT